MEEQKFRIGEIVYDAARPWQRLVITKANLKLYHCRLEGNLKRPAIAYAEKDLRRATIGDQYFKAPIIDKRI